MLHPLAAVSATILWLEVLPLTPDLCQQTSAPCPRSTPFGRGLQPINWKFHPVTWSITSEVLPPGHHFGCQVGCHVGPRISCLPTTWSMTSDVPSLISMLATMFSTVLVPESPAVPLHMVCDIRNPTPLPPCWLSCRLLCWY